MFTALPSGGATKISCCIRTSLPLVDFTGFPIVRKRHDRAATALRPAGARRPGNDARRSHAGGEGWPSPGRPL